MKECQRHTDAFEFYYALGESRSLREMQQRFTIRTSKGVKAPGFRTLALWSSEFKWQERIMLRDREVSQRVKKRVLKEEENIRIAIYNKLKQEEQLYTAQEDAAFYEKDGEQHVKAECTPKTSMELTRVQDGKRKNLETQIHILAAEDPFVHKGEIKIVNIKETIKEYKDALDEIRDESDS